MQLFYGKIELIVLGVLRLVRERTCTYEKFARLSARRIIFKSGFYKSVPTGFELVYSENRQFLISILIG